MAANKMDETVGVIIHRLGPIVQRAHLVVVGPPEVLAAENVLDLALGRLPVRNAFGVEELDRELLRIRSGHVDMHAAVHAQLIYRVTDH